MDAAASFDARCRSTLSKGFDAVIVGAQ